MPQIYTLAAPGPWQIDGSCAAGAILGTRRESPWRDRLKPAEIAFAWARSTETGAAADMPGIGRRRCQPKCDVELGPEPPHPRILRPSLRRASHHERRIDTRPGRRRTTTRRG